jgi:hypothetical protein
MTREAKAFYYKDDGDKTKDQPRNDDDGDEEDES